MALTAAKQPTGNIKDEERKLSFTTVVARYDRDLYRFAWSIAGNRDDADDVYQETLLKAFRAWRKLPPDANHRAWLFRIASNTWISDRRKQQRVRQFADDADQHVPSREPDTVKQVVAKDTLDRVNAEIQILPLKQRTALVLRKYHEMSYCDIGAVLDCSEDAARANVYEALRKLRSCFHDVLVD
jgi:RNA polymerase sigma-70 factor (ECF subfamily)